MESANAGSRNAEWWEAALMIRGQTPAERRNIRSIWIWCLVWAAGFIVANAVIATGQLHGPVAWLLAMVPIVLGVPAIRANIRFIREADEFMRKVQLEGIAIGFTAGSIFCIVYNMLERALAAPRLPVIVALVPLTFGWAIGSLLVAARHR